MPKKHQGKCVVFDVGKTFAKVSVVDSDGRIWTERRRAIPHFDAPFIAPSMSTPCTTG